MKKRSPLVLGLALTLLFLWLGFMRVDFIDSLDLKFYDLWMRLSGDPEGASRIALVNIDNDSIEKIGRWPWPRSVVAKGIDKISAGSPRVVGLNILYSEPEESSGLKALAKVREDFQKLGLDQAENGAAFLYEINQMRRTMDSDSILAQALSRSGRVVLPVAFTGEAAASQDQRSAPPELAAQGLANVKIGPNAVCPEADQILTPIPRLFAAAKGVGHLSLALDKDGVARREPLLYRYRGLYIPSYSLRLAALYLGLGPNQIQADLGVSINLGRLAIPTTLRTELPVRFKGGAGAFKSYSFFDVLNDKIPVSVFKDKLVLISVSASGLVNPLATPAGANTPLGEFTANALWSMLNKKFIDQPAWNFTAEMVSILIIGLIVTLVLPRLKAMPASLAFFVLAALLIGGPAYLFLSRGLWLKSVYPLLTLVTGYIGVVSLKYFFTEAGKEKVEGESAETNRMLGLSFQSQGMLDMAFDKFRRVPVDSGMKDILYNLALDYERKRQFNKAAAVYSYIEEHDARFKDVKERKKRMVQVGETVILGPGAHDTLLAGGADARPTLGRYEIIKQLGQGAMGIVYLGKDPRINRTCAIKTFHFEDDVDPEELKDLKSKFFVEAESAGTLNHPNIVTIYDAGEEHDLAYIAMEFLDGLDLKQLAQKKGLPPLADIIRHMADVARALDYAHQKGVVHRDIKPANLMLLKSGEIKVTDFGIARITASSRTQTGVIKGTPHYMSPEQISGQKVDGRSDIFSLGVVLYQLTTGALPFSGDNVAALMHKIMNEPHPDPREINPRLPKPLSQIINNALKKDRDRRYQRASLMADHLGQLAAWMLKKSRPPAESA